MASSMSPSSSFLVIMTTGTSGRRSLMRESVSRPPIPAIISSRKTRSNGFAFTIVRASSPFVAVSTTYPFSARNMMCERRSSISSSTQSIFPFTAVAVVIRSLLSNRYMYINPRFVRRRSENERSPLVRRRFRIMIIERGRHARAQDVPDARLQVGARAAVERDAVLLRIELVCLEALVRVLRHGEGEAHVHVVREVEPE